MFAHDVQRWSQRLQHALEDYQRFIEEIAIERLAEELAERLPEVSPIDSGALARSYTFTATDQQLIVGNDAFYALAVKRHGHDLPEVVIQEAENIIRSGLFLRRVSIAAARRAGLQ